MLDVYPLLFKKEAFSISSQLEDSLRILASVFLFFLAIISFIIAFDLVIRSLKLLKRKNRLKKIKKIKNRP